MSLIPTVAPNIVWSTVMTYLFLFVSKFSDRSDEYQCFACGMVLDESEKRKVYFNFH